MDRSAAFLNKALSFESVYSRSGEIGPYGGSYPREASMSKSQLGGCDGDVFQALVADAFGILRRPDRSCACSGSSCCCWTGGWLLDWEVAPAPMKAVAFQ